MAEILIVYYSLEGNVDFAARSLAKELDADLCRLETVKEYPKKGLLKFLHGGKDTVMGFKPELKTQLPDLSAYSKIVVGAPVWAGKPAAPITTFMEEADFQGKDVYLLASSAGGNADKTLSIMTEAVSKRGGSVKGTEQLTNPARNIEQSLEKIKGLAQTIRG